MPAPRRRFLVTLGGPGGRSAAVETAIAAQGDAGSSVVVVDGVSRSIDARFHGDGWLSWIDGTRVVWARLDGSPAKGHVALGGEIVPVALVDGDEAADEQAASVGVARGPFVLKAVIPGRVVKILVKAGDAVKAAQPILVVEAMKMENELRAPRDGVVAAVKISEGAALEMGQELVVID